MKYISAKTACVLMVLFMSFSLAHASNITITAKPSVSYDTGLTKDKTGPPPSNRWLFPENVELPVYQDFEDSSFFVPVFEKKDQRMLL